MWLGLNLSWSCLLHRLLLRGKLLGLWPTRTLLRLELLLLGRLGLPAGELLLRLLLEGLKVGLLLLLLI